MNAVLPSGEALASAASTTSRTSSEINALSALGVTVYLNVTVDAGGGETLALQVEAKDPVSGTWGPVTTTAAVATPTFEILTLYPGVAETVATTHHQVAGVPVPRQFRVKVTHSASTSWTYSVGYALLP